MGKSQFPRPKGPFRFGQPVSPLSAKNDIGHVRLQKAEWRFVPIEHGAVVVTVRDGQSASRPRITNRRKMSAFLAGKTNLARKAVFRRNKMGSSSSTRS